MSATPRLSRVQKKGQVTIPADLRAKLGLAEGDLVAFIETEAGILLTAQTVVARAATAARPQPPAGAAPR